VSYGKKCGALLFSLNFLLVLFFVSRQRKEYALGRVLQYVFPFFACAKKGTKKAQPILMRSFPSLDHHLAKIGIPKPNCSGHFRPNTKQDGMNCLR